MLSTYEIIIKPHITEKTVSLSYGREFVADEINVRKYTFVVNGNANKLQVKAAIEAIYNEGKDKGKNTIKVTDVHMIVMKGKKRRVGKNEGYRPDFKKAVVTLAAGQMLEDYGV